MLKNSNIVSVFSSNTIVKLPSKSTLLVSSSVIIIVSSFLFRKYLRLCCAFKFIRNKFSNLLSLPMPSNSNNSNMQTRRPPSFEGWENDLVSELNDTVDIHALSRDMPRLKVCSPARHSIRNEALLTLDTKKRDEQEEAQNAAESKNETEESLGDRAFNQQLEEKADRMCAALLHLEELFEDATGLSSGRPTVVVRSNAPDAQEDDDPQQQQQRNENTGTSSPLRKNSIKMYPKFSKDADLSSAFLALLRETKWLPSDDEVSETSAQTGKGRGKLPCDQLLPQVRILGTMAQTVIFAPSRRIAHLMWHPDYSTNLMDSNWEVFLTKDPWPSNNNNNIKKKKSSSTKTTTTPSKKKKPVGATVTEKSPLLGGASSNSALNNDDDADDEEIQCQQNENNDNENENRPTTPATQIAVKDSSSADRLFSASEIDDKQSAVVVNQMIYVCHRIVARNVVSAENLNRHPRFQIHWVLEIQCDKNTGVIKRARIAGVRVRLMDDERDVESAAACGGSCCSGCGSAAEWKELVEELEDRVQRSFGVEVEKKNDQDPF